MMMDKHYLEQMRAHVDEGGKLTHINAIELLAEIERLRPIYDAAYKWHNSHETDKTRNDLIEVVELSGSEKGENQ